MARRSGSKLDSFGTASTNRIRPGTSGSCPIHLLAILHAFLPPQMMLILLAAAAVSIFLGDYSDSIAIGAIVVLNALLGFAQEYRAEKALVALKKLAVPRVRVRRDARSESAIGTGRRMIPIGKP